MHIDFHRFTALVPIASVGADDGVVFNESNLRHGKFVDGGLSNQKTGGGGGEE